eukprot:COSAG02_NODE_79_length_40228_cov_18.435762_10_plen_120_part_00
MGGGGAGGRQCRICRNKNPPDPEGDLLGVGCRCFAAVRKPFDPYSSTVSFRVPVASNRCSQSPSESEIVLYGRLYGMVAPKLPYHSTSYTVRRGTDRLVVGGDLDFDNALVLTVVIEIS